MSARPTFVHELEQLNIQLIRMGALIETAIEHAIQAFKEKDLSLAKEVVDHDREINDLEKLIEGKCLSLILLQQPVAKDLRTVSTALKMVTDMERIGDQAADIAGIVLEMQGNHIYHIVEHIPAMAKTSKQMVRDSIASFVGQDLHLAKQTMLLDDEVDTLFNKVKNDVVKILKESTEHYDRCIDFLMIAKYLERIGDHAVNICEWVEFNQTGEYKHAKII